MTTHQIPMASRPSRDPLTCRFKRTTAEAFPCDAREAVAIEVHRVPMWKRALFAVADVGAAVLVGVMLAAMFVHGWSMPG